jgi:hypothetical protein
LKKKHQGLEKGFTITKIGAKREHQGLEKQFNIAEIGTKRERQGLEKGFNITKIGIEKRKLHRKHLQRSASQRKCTCIIDCPSYILHSALQQEHQQPYLDVFSQVRFSFNYNHDLCIE